MEISRIGFGSSPVIGSPSSCGNILFVGGVFAVAAALAVVGTARIDQNRIVLRDSSEALSFVQDLVDLLGALFK